jgi:cysteine dioxygenase
MPLSPALRQLFARLDECPGTPSVSDLERCLLEAPLDLADVLPHTASDRDHYVRTLLRVTDCYESLVMCWLPGQHSPVHDHGGAACGVRLMQGAATETMYTIGSDGLADPILRRVFYAGDVVSASDDDVHSLGNFVLPGEEHHWPMALVTLHVYAPGLGNCRKYRTREATISAASFM